VATHRWGYACCLLCDRTAECGKVEVPALEGPIGDTAGTDSTKSHHKEPEAAVPEEATPGSERCAAELARILATEAKKPFEVLGLAAANASSYAVRNAFRRLALIVHPDKNPGDEERCHRALLRAQGAREAALALLAAPPAPSMEPAKPRPTVTRPRERAPGKEPQKRSDFESAEAFVSHALQYVLDEWYRFVDLALPGDAQKRREASARRAATAAAATGGAEGVLRSEVALQQTTKSVKALSKLLGNQELGAEIVAKVERVCRGMLEKEYAAANQAQMAEAVEESIDDMDWLSDYVISVLKSPTWVVPIQEFIDKNAILFDEAEESMLEHTTCHNDFKELVSNLLLCHLMEVSITEEQFDRFCETGLTKNRSLHRALAEQLLAAEDFLTFKAMMSKHNAEICRVVAGDETEGVTHLARAVVKNSLNEGLLSADDWQIYDDPLLGAEVSDAVDFSALEAEAKREEAELQQAIALSLSIEEERLRQMTANEEQIPDVPVAPPPPPPAAGFTSAPLCHLDPETTTSPRAAAPARLLQTEPLKLARKPWGFTSAPLVSRPQIPPPPPSMATPAPATFEPAPPSPPNDVPSAIPRLPGRAGFTSSPLCNVPPKPRVAVGAAEDGPPKPPPPPAEEAEKAATASTASRTLPPVQAFRTNLQLWKRRASEAVQPLPKQLRGARSRMFSPPSSPKSAAGDFCGPSEEERQQRADHLRRQRDRLIEKRAKDREQQLSEFGGAAHLDKEVWAALGRRRVAELSGAQLANEAAPSRAQPESAEKLRQALTRQLLQSLAQSMVSDAEVLDAYMDLAIGNKAWHTEVPTLMEGGMDGLTGIERGRMWKQARTAQRLNAAKAKSNAMDDEEVRRHVVALRRLLTVAQALSRTFSGIDRERGRMPRPSLQPVPEPVAARHADVVSYNKAIAGQARMSKWIETIRLLRSMENSRMRLDVISFTSTVKACSLVSRWDFALRLMAIMDELFVTADAILYGAAISACEKGWLLAASLLGEMKHLHLRLDVVNFNASVSICGRGHAWLMSVVLLASMCSKQVVPDVFSLTSAINACESTRQWEVARALLVVMSLNAVQSHLLSYNSATSVCGHSSEWSMAVGLLACAAINQLSPDIVSYNATVEGCAWSSAIHYLMRCTRKAALRPTPISYTAAFDAAGPGASWSHSLHLLRTMHVSANAISYNTALKALPVWTSCLILVQQMKICRLPLDAMTLSSVCSNWFVAAGLLTTLVEQTHQLNTVSFNSILASIEGGGQWRVATSLVSGLDRHRLLPDMFSFSLAIRACQEDGQEAAALELLRGAQALQLYDTFTFNSAIGVCHVGGDWNAAIGLQDRMIALGLQPDVITQSSMISVCERAAQWRVGLKLLASSFEKKVEADLFCLNSALSTCEKARRLQAALMLLQSSVGAGSVRLEPDVISFNSVIRACADDGRWLLALGLFMTMRMWLEPNLVSYNSLIITCARRGRWSAALGFLEALRSDGLVPSIITHSSIAATCSNSGAWRCILGSMADMEWQRVLPTAKTYVSAVNACELAKDWTVAASLFAAAGRLGVSDCRTGSKRVRVCSKLPAASWRRPCNHSC
ncbi:unnamed protein product, partial [Symbiodinium sp. CCMP2456]